MIRKAKSKRIHVDPDPKHELKVTLSAKLQSKEHLPSHIHKSSGSDWIMIPEHLHLPPVQFQNSTLIMSTSIVGAGWTK
jgi:hypothetical protein